MNKIKYKGKIIKLPYPLKVREPHDEIVTRTNPFSGRSINLPAFAATVYDYTLTYNHLAEELDRKTNQPPGISEHQDDWQKVREGLDWFRQYFAKEYMVLLD